MNLQNQQGFALIIITHDLALAGKVGDRAAVMFSGRIVEEGPTSEIFRRPLHPYTKLLLDMAPSMDSKIPLIRRALKVKKEGEKGCPYYCYCEKPLDICFREEPELERIGFQRVACHKTEAAKETNDETVIVKQIKQMQKVPGIEH